MSLLPSLLAAGRRRWLPLSIRIRLTLWYVLLMALALVSFSAFLYLSLAGALHREIDASLSAVAGQLQASVEVEDGRVHLGETRGPTPVDVRVALYDGTGRRLLEGAPLWPPVAAMPTARDQTAPGGARLVTVRLSDGEGWRVLTTPIRQNGRAVAVLEVGRSEHDLAETLEQLLLFMGLAVPAALALAAGGGLFLAHRALSPIDRITRIARHIRAESLSQRLGLHSNDDEVGRLAATFDDMLDRLEESFRHQRQFTADASHELRTPLAVVSSQIDVALERSRPVAEYQEVLQAVRAETTRMQALVSQLLTLARADSRSVALEREPVLLEDLTREVVDQLAPLASEAGLQLALGRVEQVTVLGDQARLIQLLFNLVENALKYTPEGGRITVDVGRQDGWATLSVTDTGIGIAAEHLPHLFQRFYRVDKARSRARGGTGLGLAIAEWIASAHGGRIQVRSFPGQGSTFTVFLPT